MADVDAKLYELAQLWSNVSKEELNAQCPIYEQSETLYIQFYLITVVGGSCCLLGIAFNSLLLYLFIFRLGIAQSGNIYLTILCVLDLWLMLSYILTFPIGILAEYLHIVAIHNLWHQYIIYVFTMAQV
jgi:hypothetical protein